MPIFKSSLTIQSSMAEKDAKWWETADDHRFALEVLQLKLRREILKFIANNPRKKEEIMENLYVFSSLQSISVNTFLDVMYDQS